MSGGKSSAKDPVLRRVGSHSVSDDNYPSRHDGISKEEAFGYFSAVWRGKPVQVAMSADRYAHSSGISDWRVYAYDARFEDPERNGGRGEEVSGTARAALSELCRPLMMQWLDSPEYVESFQAALGRMIIRKFRDDYSASRRVAEALAAFKTRLAPAAFEAISETLEAYNAYEAAKTRASEAIEAQS